MQMEKVFYAYDSSSIHSAFARLFSADSLPLNPVCSSSGGARWDKDQNCHFYVYLNAWFGCSAFGWGDSIFFHEARFRYWFEVNLQLLPPKGEFAISVLRPSGSSFSAIQHHLRVIPNVHNWASCASVYSFMIRSLSSLFQSGFSRLPWSSAFSAMSLSRLASVSG